MRCVGQPLLGRQGRHQAQVAVAWCRSLMRMSRQRLAVRLDRLALARPKDWEELAVEGAEAGAAVVVAPAPAPAGEVI